MFRKTKHAMDTISRTSTNWSLIYDYAQWQSGILRNDQDPKQKIIDKSLCKIYSKWLMRTGAFKDDQLPLSYQWLLLYFFIEVIVLTHILDNSLSLTISLSSATWLSPSPQIKIDAIITQIFQSLKLIRIKCRSIQHTVIPTSYTRDILSVLTNINKHLSVKYDQIDIAWVTKYIKQRSNDCRCSSRPGEASIE